MPYDTNYTDPTTGGFGSIKSPDLSNPFKQNLYNQYLAANPKPDPNAAVNSVTDYLNQQKTAQQQLLDQQTTAQNNFNTGFQNFTQNLPNANTLFSSAATQVGLQPAQDAATSLENTLATMPQTAAQRQQRLGGTSGMANEWLAAQQAQLSPEVQSAANTLANKQADVSAILSGDLAQQQTQLLPWQQQGQFLSQQAAAQVTMFGQQEQETFNALLTKVANDQALTMAEVSQINTLAQKNQDYQNQLALYKQFPQLTGTPWYATGGSQGGQAGQWSIVQ